MIKKWFAKFTLNLADAVDKILDNAASSEERDKELRKLLSKYAPCPVEEHHWSLINSVDFNFDGFKSQSLSDSANTQKFMDIMKGEHTPNLTVLRDMGLAAKLAYEDPKVIRHICHQWNMGTSDELFFSFNQTQAYIMADDKHIVLSFRGTELINPKDWAVDFQLKFSAMQIRAMDGADVAEGAPSKALAHHGFLDALGLLDSPIHNVGPYDKLCGVLNDLKAENKKKIWITGHSLGAALASIFVAQLVLDNNELLDSLGGLYTFGQPRCGDEEYCKLFTELVERGLVYRVVNKKDLVTRLPMEVLKYDHHGCKVAVTDARLVMKHKEDKIEVKPQKKVVLPKNSGLKKLVFALVPDSIEDHYPSEYVRNIQLFV